MEKNDGNRQGEICLIILSFFPFFVPSKQQNMSSRSSDTTPILTRGTVDCFSVLREYESSLREFRQVDNARSWW